MAKKRIHPLTIIGSLGLAWNIAVLAVLIGDGLSVEATRYTMTAAERALDDLTPNWMIIGSIVSITGGLVGTAGLLLRKSWSVLPLMVSLFGLIGQDVAIGIAISLAGTLPGILSLAFQILSLIIAVALLALAMSARDSRVLR